MMCFQAGVETVSSITQKLLKVPSFLVPLPVCTKSAECFFMLNVTSLHAIPREPLLKLADSFQDSNGWNLHSRLNTWACKQPWRKVMPCNLFTRLVSIHFYTNFLIYLVHVLSEPFGLSF